MTGRSSVIRISDQMAPLGTIFSRELMVSCSSQTFVSSRKLNFPFIFTPKPGENCPKDSADFSLLCSFRPSLTHYYEIGQRIIFGTVRDNAY